MSPDNRLERLVEGALASYADSWTPDLNASAQCLEERLKISRRRTTAAVVAAAAVLTLLLGTGLTALHHRAAPPTDRTPHPVLPVVPKGASATDLGSSPLRVGVDGRTAWVGTASGELVAVDTSTGAIRSRTRLPKNVPGGVFDIEPTAGLVWVSERYSNLIVAVSQDTRQIVHRIRTTGDRGPFGMAMAGHTLWATAGDQLLEIDPTTGTVRTRVQLPPRCHAYDLAVSGDSVWVTDTGPPYRLVRYDESTQQITTVPLPGAPVGVAASEGSLWIGLNAQPWLIRVDASTGTIAGRVRLPAPALAVTGSPGSVWVGVPTRNEVDQVDTQHDRLVRRWLLGRYPPFALASHGQLFVTSNQTDQVFRVRLP